MSLTDTAIRTAKPQDKPVFLTEGKGLYLLLNPNGSKWWRLNYRFAGKRKTLSMGVYPDVGLKEARERRDQARKLLANGVDPGEVRKQQKAANAALSTNCFETVAREWFAVEKKIWSEKHATKILRRLERDVFPWLGDKAMDDITPPEVLATIRRVEHRAAYTAKRVKENIGQVFSYGIENGRCVRNPTADFRRSLIKTTSKHFAAITDPKEVGAMLRAFEVFNGTFVVRSALCLAPLVFSRPGELRQAEWKDIDLDKAEWRYLVSKTNTDHLVPLSTQAIAILKELHPLTGQGRYVFPGGRDPKRPMSDAAINAALRRMGFDTKTEITGHGFRAMARTLLHEELQQKPEVIEHQLAHSVPDTLGTAYNRTKFLKERKEMMQLWADYLDKLKTGAEIIPLRDRA